MIATNLMSKLHPCPVNACVHSITYLTTTKLFAQVRIPSFKVGDYI